MSDRELRLRLTIRRHGVPEVKLVWNVPTGPDWTVAKLIAQVNEVIPLESGEWGLEDYAVELKGTDGEPFECLHFQQVSKILKDDDQVIIRSLLTDDIKRRRLSGRHQISFDGKHLVDGLAFGRPWLRTPRDRPAVPLPPRKRARLIWDSVEHDDEDEDVPEELDQDREDSPLLLEYETPNPAILPHAAGQRKSVRFRADGESPDDDEGSEEHDSQSSSDSSDDESLMACDEESLLDELRDIQEDHAAVEGDHVDEETEHLPAHQQNQASDPLVAAVPDATYQAWLTTLRLAFPEQPDSEIKKTLTESHHDVWEAYRRLDRQLYLQQAEPNPVRPSNPQSMNIPSSSISSSDSSSDSDSDSDSDNEPKQSHHIELGDDSDNDSDFNADNASDNDSSTDSSSSDSSSDDSDESDNVTPTKITASHKAKPTPAAASEDGSENDDTVIRYPIKDARTMLDSDGSSSSSESSSSSDDSSSESEPEELTSKPPVGQSKPQPVTRPTPKSPSPAVDGDQPTVPPGRGMRKTQKRNLRRRLAKQMNSQDQSELSINEPAAASTPVTSKSQEEAEFLARKKALLELMEVDSPENSQDRPKKKTRSPAAAATESSVVEAPPTPLNNASDGTGEPGGLEGSTSSAASRRMKLNVDAGRRMLFGALGLRNPKTKADEEKLRTKLMKDVRPHTNPRTAEAKSNQADESTQANEDLEEEDPDAWRQKINCRAVECCDEGIELSEPPFPFVQRWDPQQQYDQWKKGKRKRPQRNAAQFYQEDDSQYSKKQKFSNGDDSYNASYAAEGESTYDDIVLQYDDAPEEPIPAKQFTSESQVSEAEDLPPVPSDLSTLKDLRPGEAKPYMVITWKQWLLSAQTNWQPQLSNVTAVVVKTEGDEGSGLRLLLAMRDRGLDKPEKTYDEGTGKRIYDKFEAPDMDEDEDEDQDEDDDGYRDLQFSELIEPKILLAAGTQKQDAWTDSVVRETQYEQGQNTDEGHANGYGGEAMMDQPPVADDAQEAMIFDDNAAIVNNTAGPLQHASPKATPDHEPQLPDAQPSASPSRQLEPVAENGLASEQASHMHGEDHKTDASPSFLVQNVDNEGQPSQHDDLSHEQLSLGPLPSDVSSVPSGRQPDPDFSMDVADVSPAPSAGADEGPGSSESTPKAKSLLKTPSKRIASEPSSSSLSLPSISEIWATATSRNSQSTQSPSRAMAESVLKKKMPMDAEYEEAMRRIDDGEDDEEELPETPKKQLFPNATQPAKASGALSIDDKTLLMTDPGTVGLKSSDSQIAPGSQVITLSSDPEVGRASPEEQGGEEDDRAKNDEDSPAKGPSKAKKKGGQQRKEGKMRAVSMPAKGAKLRRSRRTSVTTRSASTSGKGRRAP